MRHVFGFAGYSGSGKTTLIERVVPRLRDDGYSVSLIKHAHHRFDVDTPGKDSYRHRAAGCSEVLITSELRWALMSELRGASEPSLEQHLARLSPCDLVLVEGFKHAAIPKIEIHRRALNHAWLHPSDPNIVAIATDAGPSSSLPQFSLDDIDGITRFLVTHCGLPVQASSACG